MRHLDEGTIHAWIDGAASAEESRDIEVHIATCDACAAMVAEARGLVAGASRILTGLDHVPAGVIPRGAPAAPIPGAASGRRAGWWSRSPALRAAAVLLILGGGTIAVLRQSSGNGSEFLDLRGNAPVLELPESSVPATGADAADESRAAMRREAESADAYEGSAQSATAPQTSGEVPSALVAPGAGMPRRVDQGADVQGSMGRAEERAAGGRLSAAADDGARKAAAPPPPTPAPAPSALRTESVAVANRAQAQRDPEPAGVTGGLRRPQVDSAVVSRFAAERQRAMQDSSELARVSAPAGGITIQQEARRFPDSIRLSGIVATGPEATPGVELAGCYAITLAPWFPPGDEGPRSPALPPVLTLEGRMLEVVREGPRMALRVPGDTVEPTPAGSYWMLAGRDSLVLVWRATDPETIIRLGGGEATRTGVAEQEDRRASVTAERIGDRCIVREGEDPQPRR